MSALTSTAGRLASRRGGAVVVVVVSWHPTRSNVVPCAREGRRFVLVDWCGGDEVWVSSATEGVVLALPRERSAKATTTAAAIEKFETDKNPNCLNVS